ncbi:MAG: YdeI/OmpD-associated family protein [Aldersonia sp.]|nr:YdeI/OmpD-associated family protein [Aldersonia sp.]
MSETPELLVADTVAWHAWLAANHATSSGVRLVLAKKGASEPTRLTYADALTEALCYGWIDGHLSRRDDVTYCIRFTPRRARSAWSKRNTETVERLIAEGRMQPAGLAQVEQARADGRWDRAYAGSASIDVPDDLRDALAASPRAQAMWDVLTRRNRYAVLYRVHQAKRAETRARRIEQYVEMLARGDTPYPQQTKPEESSSQRGGRGAR